MSSAGGSAQERYETLSARYRAGRRRRLIANLIVATIAAVAAVILLRENYGSLIPWAIGAAYLVAILKGVVEPDHIRAWSIGASGERVTGEDLGQLPEGYRVLHDLRIPGSRANVDHVVIGPTGVFVVESKRVRGKLRVRGDEVRVAGRRKPMVEEVLREVDAVDAALAAAGVPAVPVTPVLNIQEADPPWFLGRPAGIPIVLSGRKLRKLIASGDDVLSPSDVDRAVDALLHRLGRTAPPKEAGGVPTSEGAEEAARTVSADTVRASCPRCGSEMVVRRSRQGEAFLGCSTFPRCRGTRPWEDR